jgi:hypothetical protein
MPVYYRTGSWSLKWLRENRFNSGRIDSIRKGVFGNDG